MKTTVLKKFNVVQVKNSSSYIAFIKLLNTNYLSWFNIDAVLRHVLYVLQARVQFPATERKLEKNFSSHFRSTFYWSTALLLLVYLSVFFPAVIFFLSLPVRHRAYTVFSPTPRGIISVFYSEPAPP